MKSIRLSAATAALAICLATGGIAPASAFDAAGVQPGNDTGQAGAVGGPASAGGPGTASGPRAPTGPGGGRGVDTADAPLSGPDGFGPGAHPHGFGGHGPGAPGPDMPLAHLPLHGLQLTDVQQDKVFAIMHAQAPQRREHQKAIRKAHDALRDLAHADKFDDARAAALARDLGQAMAADALLQARTQAQLLAVLTPEQRDRLRQRRARGPEGHGPVAADAPGGPGSRPERR